MLRLSLLLALLLSANSAFSACSFDIETGDAIQWPIMEMVVEASCESVTVNLNHGGSLPKAAMGHNWVLTTDADFMGVANDGVAAGPDGNYLPADDARIIAATDLIGGGESTSITFSIADLDAGGSYTYFCSFPGHWAVMKGAFKIM